MLKLREILRQNFLVHVFILNCCACQCFAMMPTEGLVSNFSRNAKSMFSAYDESRNRLGLDLVYDSETNIYNLSVAKLDDSGVLATRILSSTIIHDHDRYTLNFGYGFIFSLINGSVCLNEYLSGLSGYFRTNADVLIADIHFGKSFSITANEITIQNGLNAGNSLKLVSKQLLNEGTISAPFLSISASKTQNAGVIVGDGIFIESETLTCSEQSSISSSGDLHITAREIQI